MSLQDFHAPEVEKHLLGAVLWDYADAGAALAVPPSDFGWSRHEVIADAMRALDTARKPITIITLSQELSRSGKLVEAGGEDYLREICAEVVSTAHVEAYAEMVREKAKRRRLIAKAGRAFEAAQNPSVKTEDAEKLAMDLVEYEGEKGKGAKHIREHLRDYAAELELRAKGEKGGLMTGLKDVDDILLGLKPSMLTVIAARPSMGKSALALQIAIACKAPVVLYTLEMLAVEQIERLIAQNDPRFDSYSLSNPHVIKAETKAIAESFAKLASYPLWMNEATGVNPMQMLTECRMLKRKQGIQLVVVDYLQLVDAALKGQPREREVNFVSQFLKRMGNELNVHVIAVAALSRKCEEREDKRPISSDLRESGQIESDAHKIVMIYRPEIYSATDENRGVAELLIRKNRGGKIGRIPAVFRDKETKFYDMEENQKRAYLASIGQGAKQKPERGPSGKDRQIGPEDYQ